MEHIFVLLYFQWISIHDGFLPRHMATVALADFVFGGADDPLRLGVFAKRVVQPRPGRCGPWFQWKCLVVFPLSTLNNYHLRTWWFLRPVHGFFVARCFGIWGFTTWSRITGSCGRYICQWMGWCNFFYVGGPLCVGQILKAAAHWAPELINDLRSPVDLKASLKDYKKTRY